MNERDLVLALHVALGGAAIVASIVVIASTPARRWFGQALSLSHSLVFACGLLGLLVLGGSGPGPDDPLHARVYGPFMAIAVVAAYGFRTADTSWNARVFRIAAVFIALLGSRAMVTG